VLLTAIWGICLVRRVCGGFSIRDSIRRGILRRLLITVVLRSNSFGIVVVVDWLSISIVVVHWNHRLGKRSISGFCSTDNYQLLCRSWNRCSIVDDLVLMMMMLKMLISEQSSIGSSAASQDAA
jgi:hypothetical protein